MGMTDAQVEHVDEVTGVDPKYKDIFGIRLKQLRVQHRMTQTELRQHAKLRQQQQAISNWEKGEKIPDFATVKKLARVFGKSAAHFFDLPTEAAVLYAVYGRTPLTAADEMGETRGEAEGLLLDQLQALAPELQVRPTTGEVALPAQPFRATVVTVAPGAPEIQLRHLRARLWPLAVQHAAEGVGAGGRHVVVVVGLDLAGGYTTVTPEALGYATREARVLGLEVQASNSPEYVLSTLKFLRDVAHNPL